MSRYRDAVKQLLYAETCSTLLPHFRVALVALTCDTQCLQLPRSMCVRMAKDGWRWSGAFQMLVGLYTLLHVCSAWIRVLVQQCLPTYSGKLTLHIACASLRLGTSDCA